MHLVRGHALLLLQQVDDVLLLLDVAGRDVGRLVDDVLARDGAGDDDVLAAAGDADRLAGEQLLHLLDELLQVAADVDLVGLMPPARSHTNIEIVPGALPWISSCCGAVTIASATSGTGQRDARDRRRRR